MKRYAYFRRHGRDFEELPILFTLLPPRFLATPAPIMPADAELRFTAAAGVTHVEQMVAMRRHFRSSVYLPHWRRCACSFLPPLSHRSIRADAKMALPTSPEAAWRDCADA